MPDGGSIDIQVSECQANSDPALQPGPLSETVRDRHRQGHDAGDLEAGGRAVLLLKAARQRHRPRPVDGARPCGAARRRAATVERGGQGHHRDADPAGCDRRRPKPKAPAQRSQKVNRSAVILFVDDDPLIAMSTTEMLEDLGHHVIGANSGRARARYHQERAADRPDDDRSRDARHDRHRTRGRLAPVAAVAADPARHRLRRTARRAPSSICRGWQNPITRTSCATGSISCSARACNPGVRSTYPCRCSGIPCDQF